jgi:hypothetical protein
MVIIFDLSSMKKTIFFCLATGLLFLGFGCVTSSFERFEEEQVPTASISSTDHDLPNDTYLTFVINVHDWVYPEQSIATVHRILDLHEQYDIPVDIYLDDPLVQIYVQDAPELIERLKTSPVVAVSYHVRPPAPYYSFDFVGLDEMNQNELMDLLTRYEFSRLDLETGEPTDEPGGYAYLKELMGYAPYAVGGTAVNIRVAKALAGVYADMGALFCVMHGRVFEWRDEYEDLWMRPEDVEVKVYEQKMYASSAKMIEQALQGLPSGRPTFVNLKWHEDNFYTSGTPWGPVFWENPEEKTGELMPPFDLSKAGEGVPIKTEEQQAEQWRRYEEAFQYAQAHQETLTAVNMRFLASYLSE